MANQTRSPYIGLRPFSAADSAFFFGRETERRIVGANITASSLTVLYGPSGVGKSSVLDGGILHDFAELAKARGEEPRFAAAYFRDWSKWREDPMSGVAQAIHEHLLEGYDIKLGADVNDFRGTIDEWMRRQPGGLLIVLDQFEEYLLYHRGEDSRDSFAVQFPEMLTNSSLRVNFLISLRDDALSRLDRFKARVPNLFDNRLQLKLLSRAEGRKAILRPLEKLRADGRSQVVIEDALVEAVLSQVAVGRVKLGPGGEGELAESLGDDGIERPIEAPYLQLVMERLWNEEEKHNSCVLRLATFQSLGEAKKIIQDHLDSRMSKLAEDEQEIAASVFRYLVTPSGAKIALSPYDLAHSASIPEDKVEPVLGGLAQGDARILRAVAAQSDTPEESRYEIFHDALARAILDWTERRKKAAEEKKLRNAEARFKNERRRRMVNGAAAIGLGAFVVLLMFVLMAARNRATRESGARALAAQATRSLTDDPERSLLIALYAASQTYGRNGVLLPELDEVLHRTLEVARTRAVISGRGGMLLAIAVTPDGSTLATGDILGTIRLWDASSGESKGTLIGHTDAIRKLAFSPDGKRLVSASDDSTARVWRIRGPDPAKDPLVLRGHRGALMAVAFDPKGQWILTGSVDRTARLWSAMSGKPDSIFEHPSAVMSVGFLEFQNRLVTGSYDGVSRVWERDGRLHCEYDGQSGAVYALAAIPPYGFREAEANQNGALNVWSTLNCVELFTLPGHTNSLFEMAVSPDGSAIASASSDGTVKVWSTETHTQLYALVGHSAAVAAVTFSPDGRRLYTASYDSTARMWEASRVMSEVEVRQPEDEGAVIRAVAFNPKLPQLAAVDQYGRRILISYLLHPRRNYARAVGDTAYSVAFSRDGDRIAVGVRGGVKVFDAATTNLVAELDSVRLNSAGVYPPATTVSFSHDGARIAMGDTAGAVALWRPSDSSLMVLRGHSSRVNSVAFSPIRALLVTAGDDGGVVAWDLSRSGNAADTLEQHDGRVTSAVFSRAGDMLATSSDDHLINVSSTDGEDLRLQLRVPNNTVWSMAFNEDGSRLASASFDGTARLWRIPSGEEVTRLRADRGRMYGVAFSQDSQYVAASGGSGEVHISIIDPRALLVRAWDYVTRALTPEECSKFLGLDSISCPQAPRLVAEGHGLARAGEIQEAVAKFAEAQRLDPIFRHVNADSLARSLAADAWISRGLAFLASNRPVEAMKEFRNARSVDTSRVQDIVADMVGGIATVLGTGDTSLVGPALAAYRDAKQWDPKFEPTAETLNNVCWWGTIGGYPGQVADICDDAVKASPDFGSIHDSRGVNRAMRGDIDGAIQDFRVFVAQATGRSEAPQRARRQRWINALKARGPSPFTPSELAELRRENTTDPSG